jgi:hypothetical protein
MWIALWLITLTWDQPTNAPVNSNRIERGTCSENGFGTFQTSYTVQPANTQYDVSMPDGQCYAFRVYAKNTDGESGPSNVVQYKGPAPNPPTDVKAP